MDLSPARAGRYGRAGVRWARLLASRRTKPGVRVFYGHDRVPAPGERAAGGTAKAQKLAARWPNSPVDFSVLYLGEPLGWNHAIGFLCLVAGTFFIFHRF